MATVSWKGGAGDWVGSNWSTGSQPGATDSATLSAGALDVSSSDYVDAGSLSVTGGTLTIEGGLTIGDSHINGLNSTITNTNGSIVVTGGGLTAGQYVAGASGSVTVGEGATYLWEGASSTQTVVLQEGAINASFVFTTNFGGAVKGFGSGQSITYSTSLTVTRATVGNNIVSFFDSAGEHDIHLIGNYNSSNTTVSGNSIQTTVACFCAGTAIETGQGEQAAESLQPGDLVRTASGALRPVRWVGRRSYAGPSLAARPDLHPVRVARGALGGGLPRRDLCVSPSHALLIDGVLVLAGALLNGNTIRQLHSLRSVDYVHIELDGHDALLAEGAPAESFRDDGSRGLFDAVSGQPAPRTEPCAPLVEDGPILMAIRRRLDGAGVHEVWLDQPGRLDIRVPHGAISLRLLGRTARPAGDARRLAAAIGGLAFDGQSVGPDDVRLGAGWHAREAGWRWTDGAALLPIPPGTRDVSILVTALAA